MKAFFCLALVAISCAAASAKLHPLSDEFIDSINSKQSTWVAGRNFAVNTSMSYIKGLVGVLKSPAKILPTRFHDITQLPEIPETFDAREEWPDCSSIGKIRDQAACGSCWALGAVEAMTDRICIFSKGENQVSVSAEDLLDCCSDCGYGCEGGYLETAWSYWVESGISSGGDYGDSTGCKAYSLVPCAHHIEESERPACGDILGTPACVRACDDSSLSYQSELTFGESSYNVHRSVAQIQAEILTNGPVEAAFDVYEDFLSYKSGVYQHVEGRLEGGHAIKIIGWGEEEGTPYWLIANSWNSDWGDNGYFKMLRGKDHVGIESDVVAGIPKL